MSRFSVGQLSKDIEEGVLKGMDESITKNGALIQEIVDSLLEPYCTDLDVFMANLDNAIKDSHVNPITDEELEQALLKLTSLIYYVSSASENLGIRSDISEMLRKETYNAFLTGTEGTIIDRQAMAEANSTAEKIYQIGYNRAYNKLKDKVEGATEMQATLKKLLSRRMLALENYKYARTPNE